MLLCVDAALGVVTAALVLAQAVLLARIVARSFDGATLDDVSPTLGVLAGIVAVRAVTAWGF